MLKISKHNKHYKTQLPQFARNHIVRYLVTVMIAVFIYNMLSVKGNYQLKLVVTSE